MPGGPRAPSTRASWTAARIAHGGLDVLAQHVIGVACAGPFDADALFDEVRRAAPYASLSRCGISTPCSSFVATGGYALTVYERYRRLARGPDGPLAAGRSDGWRGSTG